MDTFAKELRMEGDETALDLSVALVATLSTIVVSDSTDELESDDVSTLAECLAPVFGGGYLRS